jgi:hypothetical protein
MCPLSKLSLSHVDPPKSHTDSDEHRLSEYYEPNEDEHFQPDKHEHHQAEKYKYSQPKEYKYHNLIPTNTGLSNALHSAALPSAPEGDRLT